MRRAGTAVLLLSLACSPGLFAGVLQTSKGMRISILGQSSAEDPKKESAEKAVAHVGGKEKTKPASVAKANTPKGKVKVRSVAGSRWKKGDRRQTGADSVASHK